MPCGRWLNGGALSLSAERPSGYTNIAGIRTYCTRPESERGEVWRTRDFRNLGHALSFYVNEAAEALYPGYDELNEAKPNAARMYRWAVWDMQLKEIVPDATVLGWIADKFPDLDQDTASVGEVVHADASRRSSMALKIKGLKLNETAVMVVYARRGEYSIHTRRLGNLAAHRSAGPSSQRACLQDPRIWSSRCSLRPATMASFPAKPGSWITPTVTMLPRWS